MNHGSLFSGIGGFDLAAEWMGWNNIFHCEWAEFPRKILKHHFPNSLSYEDITKTDFTKHRGEVDILSGGFPCQPFSTAGKRKGTEDSRYLWPEMLRVIREVRPRWVVGENVYGLVNWDGGLVFDTVCADLENEGFQVLPVVLPACSVNAPHRRDRIWFIAHALSAGAGGISKPVNNERRKTGENRAEGLRQIYGTAGTSGIDTTDSDAGWTAANTNSSRSEKPKLQHANLFTGSARDNKKAALNANNEGKSDGFTGFQKKNGEIPQWNNNAQLGDAGNEFATNTRSQQFQKRAQNCIAEDRKENKTGVDDRTERYGDFENATNTDSEQRSEGRLHTPRPQETERYAGSCDARSNGATCWQEFPTQSPICSGDDGIPRELDGITFPKWRSESIKGYGNAIVPQVALQIFKTIQQVENTFH